MSAFLVAMNHGGFGEDEWESRWLTALREMGSRTSSHPDTMERGKLWAAFSPGSGGCHWRTSSKLLLSDGWPLVGVPRMSGYGAIGAPSGWLEDPLPFLDQAVGSFAAVHFDSERNSLTLIRDRFGTKPLWYFRAEGILAAASEPRILRPLAPSLEVNPDALKEVLWYRWIVGRNHLISPFRQVFPGSVVTLDTGRAREPEERAHWQPRFRPEEPSAPLSTYTDTTLEALRRSYHELGVAGQPVAVFLSGGLDSSILAATAMEECQDVVGIVGRIPGEEREVERAGFVADHLGLDLQVVDIDPSLFPEDLEYMVGRIDHPPRHPNNLVLLQLFRAIPADTESVLIGDAAEMLFGLADIHRVRKFRAKTRLVHPALPGRVRRLLANALRTSDNPLAWRLAKVADTAAMDFAGTLDAIEYTPPLERAFGAWLGSPRQAAFGIEQLRGADDVEDTLPAFQIFNFLQASLVRHDRMAAPFGKRAVYPFLAPSVVACGLGLPRDFRFRERTKPVLRAICDRYFPKEVSRWPPLGFPVPWTEWQEGPLAPAKASIRDGALLWECLPKELGALANEEKDMQAIWSLITLEMSLQSFLEPRR